MKKDCMIDYASCILLKLLGPVIRFFPKGSALFFGRRLGDLFYNFDFKHRAIAYSNIKLALGEKLSPAELKNVTKRFYRSFGQNLIEIFFIPLIDKEYIDKYINIEGLEHIKEGFKKGRGIIFAGIHEGSWELSNIISANLGFAFSLFVRDQRYPRLNKLLNSYRIQKGCKIIQRQGKDYFKKDKSEFFGIRGLIEALKRNESIAMTADQGGKTGILAKFLGKEASMPTGAIRFALKYDAVIIPVFYTRISGPYHKVIVHAPLEIKKTGDLEKDIHGNLQELVGIFERYILAYPQEYLWTYKIWKYSRQKNILVLSDGKTGHLRQSQAVADIVTGYLKNKGINFYVATIEVKYKNNWARRTQVICASLAGKYACQGCFCCLKSFLKQDSYVSLIKNPADIIISCGASTAAVNYILSRNNQAKSIVIMRPSFFSVNKFDLVVMPRHDNPPKEKNIVVTEGALNLINGQYLKEQAEKLKGVLRPSSLVPRFYIGLLIGGDTKDFKLSKGLMKDIIAQIKSFAEKEEAAILVTTSRRTSFEVEKLVVEEFGGYSRCELLVIANKENLPFAVGGILGLAKIIIVSPESISMVSEAVSSGRHIIVFKSEVSRRHKDFLSYLAQKQYIHFVEPIELGSCLNKIRVEEPQIKLLQDKEIVRKALAGII